MYVISITSPFNEKRLDEPNRPYLRVIKKTIETLGSYHDNFLSLGVVDDNVQEKINKIIAEAEPRDEGLTDQEIAQLDEMANAGRLIFLNYPERCIDSLMADYEKIQKEYPTASKSFQFNGSGGTGRSDMGISIPPNQGDIGITIDIPYEHENDFWFNDANRMRSLISDLVQIWEPSWLVVRPWIYSWCSVTKKTNPLFQERKQFGWMGYTNKQFSAETDALALIEPMHEGTFLLLKEDMMTLWPQDIELAHRAEAFLADHDILPVR